MSLDLSQPVLVARELAAANRRLARERQVPAATRSLIEQFADALLETDPAALGDVALVLPLHSATLRALRALGQDDPLLERRELRVQLDQLSFILQRLGDPSRKPDGSIAT